MGRSHSSTCLARFLHHVRRLFTADGANVTAVFALTLVPTLSSVGAAVDYSRANSARTALQAAVDSTALMISKQAASMTETELKNKASAYFFAMFTRPEAFGTTLTTTYTTSGGSQVYIKATSTVKTEFMRVMGIPNVSISAASTVKWGNTRLRVSLVLDNTGSMSSSNKITALKTATKNLLTQLQNAAVTNGDVYVSIVPFARNVNAGSSHYNATWIDWTSWDNNNGNCTGYTSWNKPKTKSSCLSNNGSWATASHDTWNGCMTDRGNSGGPHASNYDTNVLPPDPNVTASLYPSTQDSDCPEPVVALNYNWLDMKTMVDSMSPGGNTNQGIGLVWGWLSLVGGGPFPAPPAMDANYIYQHVIILLTDGMNTENRWYTSQNSIDSRQQMTCTNVKAAGMVVYTVQVNTGNDPMSTMLKNCASSPDKYFLLTSSDQMVATFQQIGTALSNLRLAY